MSPRDDEQVADATDEYEVYERKAPRKEAPPSLRERLRRQRPEEMDDGAPAQEAWLADDHEPMDHDEDVAHDDEGALHPEALRKLPGPPAEPMRPEAPRSALKRFQGAPAARGGETRRPPVPLDPSSIQTQTHHIQQGDRTMRIAIACTEFNYDITSMMLERARAHADVLGAEIAHVVRVPGVYDLPLAVKRLVRRDDVDGVVTLGVVIEGETDHDDLVIQHAARKIVDLSLESDKPVGLGITGPGMSRLQAMARIDRAKDAVEAVVRLHRELRDL